ncbi:60S ribosomal protein RML2, mitochondrial precursor [Lodderomyces elongisporus NRRL YB-4239]|uniref:Large ribosomal subunit protein uL2m n=1 Tax=Lodderomyces elongisporus (strain ATCC 11503 / CBS 2605 / JCM 1781 / NBRC 1676 / NRRL YB-4239) TaxID=379508 RepID=A5DY19_LODEL|nr:60S ribosomal protein RML2, mitochondrial precursor [Lodderomyces elongisporus NRRL YB-4239]
MIPRLSTCHSVTFQGIRAIKSGSIPNAVSHLTQISKRFNSTMDGQLTEMEEQDIRFRKQRELAMKLVKVKHYADMFPEHTNPGTTHYKKPVHDHLHKGRPVKELTVPMKRNAGRNNTGQITVRGLGGGHKRRVRILDFHRLEAGRNQVVRIEYDPNRSGHIALLKHMETGNLSYIVAPQGLRGGDIVESFRQGIPKDFMEEMDRTNNGEIDEALLSARILQRGNCLPLRMIPVGSIIHCIGLNSQRRSQLVRAAGTFGKILGKDQERQLAIIKLCSGEQRYISLDCHATLGVVSNKEHQLISWGKAGRRRYLGKRPVVRGMAMNAKDHPHGGGRGKSKSNKFTQSMWGQLKFTKTRMRPNPMCIKNRKGRVIRHKK